tara:strand:- start:186 stop:785 length:600 start_codon:yes stop_codon:yes gene_type:complete
MLKNNYSEFKFECGLDEAGRGCLAGPVTAAAVILSPDFKNSHIDDSKKLSYIQRENLSKFIIDNCLAHSIHNIYPKKIDKINILNASILAMHKCIAKLKIRPNFLIVDGNKFKKFENINHKTIIRGDQKYLSIASASILAKHFRDKYMAVIDKKFPKYLWVKNKGYPTLQHKKAIRDFGITLHHRKSFKLFDDQLTIDF